MKESTKLPALVFSKSLYKLLEWCLRTLKVSLVFIAASGQAGEGHQPPGSDSMTKKKSTSFPWIYDSKPVGVLSTARQCHGEEAAKLLIITTLPMYWS